MRFRISALCLFAALGSAACNSQSPNPIIGEWKLVKSDCQVLTQIKYEPKQWSGFETSAGVYPGWRTVPVTYNVADPKAIWVLVQGSASNETRVFVLDANHIKPDDGLGCIYERVK